MPDGHVAATEPRTLGLSVRAWSVAAAAWTLAIAVVSLLPPRGTPGPQIADLGEVVATLGHLLAYLVLGGLVVLAARVPRPWWIWAGATAFGAALEIVQGVVGLRSFQVTDIVANALGAALGILAAMALRTRRAVVDRLERETRG